MVLKFPTKSFQKSENFRISETIQRKKKTRIYKFPKPFKAKIRGDVFSKTQAYIARFSFSFFGTYLKILFYSLRKVLRIQTESFGRPLASPICERNADRQQIKTKTTRTTTATCTRMIVLEFHQLSSHLFLWQ